jgi:hypothetical protein
MTFTDDDLKRLKENDTVRTFMDGDSWCATYWDFYNLQDSPAGFGDTELEALNNLIAECPL